MGDRGPCCRDPERLAGATSPFARVVALDWYDGPRAGLLRCGACGREYRFDLLDESAQDDDLDLRSYRLAPLPEGSIARLVEALAPYQSPNWPVWVPLWSFPTPAERSALDALTDRLLAESGPACLDVSATELSGTLIGAEPIRVDDRSSHIEPLPRAATHS